MLRVPLMGVVGAFWFIDPKGGGASAPGVEVGASLSAAVTLAMSVVAALAAFWAIEGRGGRGRRLFFFLTSPTSPACSLPCSSALSCSLSCSCCGCNSASSLAFCVANPAHISASACSFASFSASFLFRFALWRSCFF